MWQNDTRHQRERSCPRTTIQAAPLLCPSVSSARQLFFRCRARLNPAIDPGLQVPEALDRLPDLDEPYNGRIAALRYLLTGKVKERPEWWSVDRTFPFGASYRFATSSNDRGILGVLSGLRAPFLKANPEFKR